MSITNSWSSLRLTSIKSVMPSSHLILCRPLLLLPPIPPSIRVFSNESTLRMRWPKYWSFSFSIIPSKVIPGLISFRMDWLNLLAVQGTRKSLLQHHSSKARSVGAQYATGDQWRNNFRKNEELEPKQKQYPVVDVTGDRSKVRCCKEQHCIGTWNVRSTNQGKLEVVKQEMARVNVDILRISELRWTGMGEFDSDDHYIYYCGQESFRRNGVAIIDEVQPWLIQGI